jgi:hypothetical protein
MNPQSPDAPETQTSSDGAVGGRKSRTTLGYFGGEGGAHGSGWGGGDWGTFFSGTDESAQDPSDFLKDLAIFALELSESRDRANVCQRVYDSLVYFGARNEPLAHALAQLVVTAYTVASFVPPKEAFEILQQAFPKFKQHQLKSIIALSSTEESFGP